MFEHWTRKCGGFCLVIWAIIALRLAFTDKLQEPVLFGAVIAGATAIIGAMAYKSHADKKIKNGNGK